MNYSEVMQYLEKTWRFGSRLGLERVRELMRRLGDPQKDLRFIHVAGTNGKGSTVAYISTILAEAGMKVGINTSPFIFRFTDRVRILDGPEAVLDRLERSDVGEISKDDVARIFTKVAAVADEMVLDDLDSPTEFELITAMALMYFHEQACDVVVLEVGLGGRLDSTNVIDAADVSVITAIGYDHMDRLGNTIAEIASEKAGIVKSGSKAVILYEPEVATHTKEEAEAIREVIKRQAARMTVPLIEVKERETVPMERSFRGQSFRLHGYARPLETKLMGSYQTMNAALAIRAVEAFRPELIGQECIYRGIRHALWPARMELISDDPIFIIDGAHNPQAAWKLGETMDLLAANKRVVMLTGVLADKDFKPMLHELLVNRQYIIDEIVVTEPHIFRKKDADEYASGIEAFLREHALHGDAWPKITVERDIDQALKYALSCAREEQLILLAWGSLYLGSDLKHVYAKITNTEI